MKSNSSEENETREVKVLFIDSNICRISKNNGITPITIYLFTKMAYLGIKKNLKKINYDLV